MIKSYTAVTREIDDSGAAVREILESLDTDKNLLKNSIGIISCFSEFDDTGVLKAICDALPFDCIGSTTCLCSAGNETDQVLLAINVLTSDDCVFKTALIPMTESYEESIESELTPILGSTAEKPALILSFLPLIQTLGGDSIISVLDRVSGGVPLFGTAAVDHNVDYSTAKTIYNGEAFREATVLGLVYGEVKISFEISSIDKSKIKNQKALITESNGNILIGVNGKSALTYLQEIGLTKDELSMGLGILPLVIDHRDGTRPIVRAVFALTPEGHAVCGGTMPLDAALSIGVISRDDVLQTTENALGSFVEQGSTVLCYSCIARFIVLGMDNAAEAEITSKIAGDYPYLYACSGGEICPLPDSTGKLRNFFHNFTNVICKLS